MMRHDVLIVGAGPTGLVLALWLTKMGIRVRIISRADGPGTSSRALAVHARTLEFYEQADLASTVLCQGYEVGGANLWVGGKPQAHIGFSKAGAGSTRYPFLHIYPQDRHERLLVDRLAEAGVSVEWNTTLLDFDQGEAGVAARLQLPDGAETRCEARFIAGCDGASSTVRKRLGIGFPGATYEQTFYVADVEAEGPPMNGELNIDLDGSDFLAIFPLDSGRRARLVGTVREDAGQEGTHSFQTINHQAAKSLGIEVKQVNWFSSYRVHHRVVERFRDGRAFLLGDAAHIHSPAGGQGMNTGIGDAVNLAWKLAMVANDKAGERLLDTLDEERLAFARKLVATTDQAFSIATSEGRLAQLVRTRLVPVLVPLALRISALREWAFRTVSQIEIDYRGGWLSEGRAGKTHGGDRLPWIDLGGGRSNYDGFRSMAWQAQAFGEVSADTEEWCRANGLSLKVYGWQKRFGKAGFVRDAIYVLRPDAHVGFADAQPTPARLTRYFTERGIRLPLA